ncbi:MAG: hypothetical protein Q9215_002518 [Flavoplaca cf. flavocitrina]
MGTFKTPWQMSRDAEAKKQAKASKRTGTNKQAPAIGRSARSGIATPAAHVQLFLSQNDEPQESLSRTQKAPKKSTLQKRKSNLTTPAVARALRTCGRLYPNEADALADETDEDPDLEKDEEEDDEKQPTPIMSTAEYNAFSGISCSVKKDQKAYMSVWKLM